MLFVLNISYLLINLILIQFLIKSIKTEWPSISSSSIKILGLFPNQLNNSNPTTLSVHCEAMFKSAIILSQQNNIKLQQEFINYEILSTDNNLINILSNTCQIISSSNIIGIIGPAYSKESHFLAPFAEKIGIPIISYSSTDPKLSNHQIYPSFYRTISSDNLFALAIVQLFLKFNWKSCNIIYQNDQYGINGMNEINKIFNNYNITIINKILFDVQTESIENNNFKNILLTSSSRIVLLWTNRNYTNLILQNAIDLDILSPQFIWLLTSNISLTSLNNLTSTSTSNNKLNGLILIEPFIDLNNINQTLLNQAFDIWNKYESTTFPGINYVDYYALFTFDATWLLIQSLKQLCSTYSNSSCIQFLNNSFCFNKYFINSNKLFNLINNLHYFGVTGKIQFNQNQTDRIEGINYILKNIQIISNNVNFVPVLIWSSTTNWTLYSPTSLIIWPGNSLIIPSEYPSLSGIHLRIALVETPPFTMLTQQQIKEETNETKLIGYIPDLIDLLTNQMGFIPNLTLITNQTFNQIINSVSNNQFDLFIAQTTITAKRSEKVSFSNSIFDNSLRIIIRKDLDNDVNLLLYLTPFTFHLWLTLLGACLFSTFLICLLEKQDNPLLQNKSIISLIAMSLWFSIGTILGYGADFQLKTPAGRLLTIGLYILSLVLVAAYTANLASDLTISKSKDIVTDIDDIKNGKVAFSRIGILLGSAIEDYYLREISGGIHNFYPIKNKEEIYDKLLNNIIDASIMDAGILEYITNQIYCNLTSMGKDFGQSAFGIVFQKKWQYEQILNIQILALRESGELDNLKRKWFQTTSCAQIYDTSQAMTIQSMAGLFLTFAIITLLAILLFLWKKRFLIRKCVFNTKHNSNILARRSILICKPASKYPTISKVVIYDK
ncbi:unnamed protein product [Adineta steineri]|uniref:Ionotropic glutamate receptor C-terminal domain-containing protein n=2 Tax=Adineta steineri TaxID=433720 RepID=A0A819UDL9_9BILA|nr:unnamed protein product [Adineta steineri]